jgi:polar amino acid transport system substrate-binding protein
MRRFLVAVAVLALAAAACAPEDEAQEPADDGTATETTSPAEDECATETLPTFEAGQLTVATSNPVFPPWFSGKVEGSEWKNPSPEAGEGFEGAFTYALAEELGFTADQVVWVEKTYAPGAKEYDFSIQEIGITPRRAEAVDFSVGYYEDKQALITLDEGDFTTPSSIEDLQGAKLGAQIGTTGLTFIEEAIQPDEEPQVFDDTSAAKAALENGQIDGIVVDLYTALYISAVEIPGSSVVAQFENVPGVGAEEFGLTFEKGNPLVACVNQAIETLKSDGTIEALEQEWLSESINAPVLG